MRRERGFTLLEVLVALAIASLAGTMLFQGATGGLLAARVGGHVEEALSRAHSHLDALGRAGPLVVGEQSGDDGSGFRWRVRVSPLGTAPVARGDAATVARGPFVALYQVSVEVGWDSDGSPRAVRLDTERVGAVPPPPP